MQFAASKKYASVIYGETDVDVRLSGYVQYIHCRVQSLCSYGKDRQITSLI
jgi:hypothetical protein